jgi:hypothetical protein
VKKGVMTPCGYSLRKANLKRVAGKQITVDITTVYLFDCKPTDEPRLESAFTVVFTSSNYGLKNLKRE